ncbi:MAG: DUF1801 domain-containing protein [Oscillospiraceae bacterium]|jgi:uncharacterized protein YdhG (YjbR/CyaY superfamily)|nr:DUF1801 domain-containing protein [Oscillospiraceae bacterium]
MTVDEYIEAQTSEIQPVLRTVRAKIRAVLPEAEEKISWSMPTYRKGQNLVHFAAQKKHLGIYPGAEAVEAFADRLTEYKTSKGAIQFPYMGFGEEQLTLIAEIAAWRRKNNP